MAKKQTRRTRTRKDAEILESSFRSIVPKKKKEKKSRAKTSGSGGIISTCIMVLIIAVALTVGCIYLANENLDGIILENIWVAGVDVGGMTQAQAIEEVKTATNDTYGVKSMTVRVLDSEVTLSPQWCKNLNVRKAVKDAYRYGNTGSESRRKEEQQIAFSQGYVVDITPYLTIDTSAIQEALNQLGNHYNTALTQSTYAVNGTAPNQILVVSLGVPEYGLNLNQLYQAVLDAYNRNQFTAEGHCGMIEPDPIDLETILAEYAIAPVDATFDEDTYEIVDGHDGYGFDLAEATKKLEQAEFGATVEIPFVSIAPAVTKESLSATLYKDVLGTYTASEDSDSSRAANLRLACEAINGTVLLPGDVFSYNQALGQRTEAKGYKPGPSYASGQTVMTIGGGICQVSSALYYCTLLADLEIVYRDSHGYATNYMPLGMDAAVSWGSLDFRFRNTTDYPIRIEATADGGTTTVTLHGTNTKDYYVKMEYEVLSTHAYSTTYKTMEANNPQGYKDGDYIVEPSTGYRIETYRCKYNKDTNDLITREFEGSTSYNKRDAVICRIEGEVGDTSHKPGNIPGIGGGDISDSPGELPAE